MAEWQIERRAWDVERNPRLVGWVPVKTIESPNLTSALVVMKAWIKTQNNGWRKEEGEHRLVRQDHIRTVKWTRTTTSTSTLTFDAVR